MRDPDLALPDLVHVATRAELHPFQPFEDMRVYAGLQHGLDRGQEVAHEGGSPCVPAHEVPATIVVRPVEHCSGKETHKPSKQRFMPHVHPDDDLRAPAIDPEMALTDQ